MPLVSAVWLADAGCEWLVCLQAHELAQLCDFCCGEAAKLLPVDLQKTAAAAAWKQLKQLSMLLEANMADILELHRQGGLDTFTAAQLTQLLQSLFAESDMRQQRIQQIQAQAQAQAAAATAL